VTENTEKPEVLEVLESRCCKALDTEPIMPGKSATSTVLSSGIRLTARSLVTRLRADS
jgi:hypothetical protein